MSDNNKNIVSHDHKVNKALREELLEQKGKLIWFTGLSGSGKSTIANLLEQKLYESGLKTYLLDGDNLRFGLNNDLGFSDEDRKENILILGADEISKTPEGRALDKLGLIRYCCRRHVLTHVDLIEII